MSTPWKPSEDKLATERYRQGDSFEDIGKALGRSAGAVEARLRASGVYKAKLHSQTEAADAYMAQIGDRRFSEALLREAHAGTENLKRDEQGLILGPVKDHRPRVAQRMYGATYVPSKSVLE